MIKKLIFIGWIAASTSLLLYSFTQIDLGLTLTRASFWQEIQRSFQYIGYFNRPLSTYLYLFITFILFFLYFYTLKFVKEGILKRKELWKIILIVSIILFFSYNAFSYDLFNYIFDAKIVTHYQQNPYIHKALDYPADPMMSFMHWTHRTYPYGPSWLFLTVPLSFLGFGFLLPTFYLFKMLIAVSFLGSVYFLEKILNKVKNVDILFCIAFFALNPLVLIESLVSAHNDIVMIFFALLSLFILFEKKYVSSIFVYLFSIGIKFSTVFLLPAYLYFFLLSKKNKVNYNHLFYLSTFLLIIPAVLASFRTNFQPWYLLNLLPFTAFFSKKYFISIPVFIISFISLLTYTPFLYLGNWDPPVTDILSKMIMISIMLSFLLTGLLFVRNKFLLRHE